MSDKPRIGTYDYSTQNRGRVIVFNENYEVDGTFGYNNAKPWLVIKAGDHKGSSFKTFAEAIGSARYLARRQP